MKTDLAQTWAGPDIRDLLNLTEVGTDHFRSVCNEQNEHGRIYGGQLLAQALAAASKTVPPDRSPSYLQFVFLAGGSPAKPVDYSVTRLQDGKRFSSRNVRGLQSDQRIVCDASVTFAAGIESPSHQIKATTDCGLELKPECLPRLEQIARDQIREIESTLNYIFRPHVAIDFRIPFATDVTSPNADDPRMRFFIRIRQSIEENPSLHASVFAYLSDFWINFVACAPHVPTMTAKRQALYVASLNHAIWFHRPLRPDEWLLFDCRSPSGANGRGLSLAHVYRQSGEHVATATQECLLAPASAG
jgi:acyl-CoA thioesterase II